MTDVLERYRKVEYPLPEYNLRWELYGAGLENLGKGGKPVHAPMPEIGSDELLARVDAVGLCFSDIKLITQGAEHPRIFGRDLANDPTVPGHEASLTIVKVGGNLKDRFHVGERYLIQADVFYRGVSMAFGYVLPGALQQYVVIGTPIIEGDEGCYLIPVRDTDGYAEVALSEPWACVVASHRIAHRETLKSMGSAWFIGADREYSARCSLGDVFAGEGGPRRLVMSNVSGGLRAQLVDESSCRGYDLIHADDVSDPDRLVREYANGRGFDDIVILGTPSPELFEQVSKKLNNGGILAIIAETPMSRKVQIDVGRIHYDGLHFVGTATRSVADAYKVERSSEPKANGKTWIIGAGGPMGQMHTQLAASKKNGPLLVVATDVDEQRLTELSKRFGEAALERGADLITLNPRAVDPDSFDETLTTLTGGRGFDDVIVMAPVPALIEQGASWLADGGILNIFAGVPRGTIATLDVSAVYLRGVRYVGSSGSLISDLRYTLEQTQKGELSPNRSVAAIGGIYAVQDGLRAVKEGSFPGKVVIWPQLEDLPLVPLVRLGEFLPNVAEKLTPSQMWTKEAEEELLRSQLKLG